MKKIMTGLLAAAALTGLTGCGGRSTEQAYSFEEREPFLQTEESRRLPLFAENLCVVTDSSAEDPAMTAEAGGLMDLHQADVLYAKNMHEKMNPASITKVMTAILAMEEGNPDDLVTVTEDAVIREAGASLCGIHPGDEILLGDLLYGLMIPSGNDAANAIAVHLEGSIEAFAQRMNERAWELGATNTHFMNPSGLTDPDHYTTAYDLYLIFNEALKHPEFRDIIGASAYTANYTDGEGKPVSATWTVGNWYQKGECETPQGLTVLGGKTGTTKAAGYCLIMASEDQSGDEYISVVLKSDSRKELYRNMTNIITKIVN